MKADTLHKQLVDLLTSYTHPYNNYIIEGGTFFNFVKDLLLNADTKTRKVLLHWLKGYKKIVKDGPGSCFYDKFSTYMHSPWALISQMLDHLEHLNYAQKIKAPVNYDPLSYPTHFDCLQVVLDYPLPADPINPDKFRYLNKVAKMFDDDNNCYTVYKFINRKSDSLYEQPKDAFIAFVKSHFGKHAMPWCICDKNRSYWYENCYAKKYLVFKNNKLWAAAATAVNNYAAPLFDRTNKDIGTLYLSIDLFSSTEYLIRFKSTRQEDELTFTSTAASVFNPPTIPGCVHHNKPTDRFIEILSNAPFRYLSSDTKGLQWRLPNFSIAPTKQGLPSYSVIIRGGYSLPSTNRVRYKAILTIDNNKDTPSHIITNLEINEFDTNGTGYLAVGHEYCFRMTTEQAASLIEKHIKESLARTSKESNNE